MLHLLGTARPARILRMDRPGLVDIGATTTDCPASARKPGQPRSTRHQLWAALGTHFWPTWLDAFRGRLRRNHRFCGKRKWDAPAHAVADTHADTDWVEAATDRAKRGAVEPEFAKTILRRRKCTYLPRHRHYARRWPQEGTPEAADREAFISMNGICTRHVDQHKRAAAALGGHKISARPPSEVAARSGGARPWGRRRLARALREPRRKPGRLAFAPGVRRHRRRRGTRRPGRRSTVLGDPCCRN